MKKDTYGLPAPPKPPECRVIYEGFPFARVFNSRTEFEEWKKLPWYKRLFK